MRKRLAVNMQIILLLSVIGKVIFSEGTTEDLYKDLELVIRTDVPEKHDVKVSIGNPLGKLNVGDLVRIHYRRFPSGSRVDGLACEIYEKGTEKIRFRWKDKKYRFVD